MYQKMATSIKLKLSVADMNLALGNECDKYMKPNSNTQVRIFGYITVHFYEYNHGKERMKKKDRYIIFVM